jgi:hypothetical protein
MFVEDLDVFFVDFGEIVEVGDIGFEQDIKAIFDDDYQVISESEYADVSTSVPAITVKTADALLVGISRHSRVVVRGAEYVVRESKPDGSGITTYLMHEVE